MLTLHHWLCDPRNVRVLRLEQSAWEAGEAIAPVPPKPMSSWCVADVTHWLEGCDMAGPASTMAAQGVNGADLLTFESAVDLSKDVGISMFAARKILRLRELEEL